MIFLTSYLVTATKHTVFKQWMLLSLVFAWIGDVSFLFTDAMPALFILGLGMFLLSHLYYTYGMSRYPNLKNGLLLRSPIWIIPILIYDLVFLYTLWGSLTDYELPVLIYTTSVVMTGWSAMNMQGRTDNTSANLMVIGALLLIATNSIVALNQFVGDKFHIPQPSLWIMLTYITGQFLMIRGAVRANEQIEEE